MPMLERAIEFHQRGQIAEADRLYSQILQTEPEHFDALHMLGVVRIAQGRSAEAAKLIGLALNIHPESARALANHGRALLQAKRPEEALASFDRALALRPEYPEVLHERGNVLWELNEHGAALSSFDSALALRPDYPDALLDRGNLLSLLYRYDEAVESYDRALAAEPKFPEALLSRGNALVELGRHEEALASYNRALALQPNYAEALYCKGYALQAMGRAQDALASYDLALRIRPNFVEALTNRGKVLAQLDRPREALASVERALAITPNYAEALNNRGNALTALGRPAEALVSYEKALSFKPEFADAYYNRGEALSKLNRHEDALASYDESLAIKPDNAAALLNRGNALQFLDRDQEALASFERAIALSPDNAEAHWNVAATRLAASDFAGGWKEYEWRRQVTQFAKPARTFSQPAWNGARVEGTLLVWGEQGLGDEILYASMIPDVAKHAGDVVVQVAPRLVPLFARSFPQVRVIGHGEDFPEDKIQAQVSLASLGPMLRPSLDAFPRRQSGYLIADPERTAALRRRLSPKGEVVVGLSWISTNPLVGHYKTAQLGDLEPLLRLPGTRHIDLQYGDTSAERAALKQKTGLAVERLDEVDNTNDLDALAALIAACDLVVTVSNTTAHLAGALGKPTWVFAPQGHGKFWYWFKDRPDSPWYPQVRIKRQQRGGQAWGEVIASAAGEISAFVNAARHGRIS
jgi:tetratricopeptide (TPR) repeat protein